MFLPTDGALPGLSYLQNFDQTVAPLLGGEGMPLRLSGCRVMKHRPGRRMTLRLALADGVSEKTVYAKLFAGERGAEISRLLQNLSQSKKSGPLKIPRLLAYLPEAKLMLMEAARGKPLPDLLSEGPATAPAVAAALRQLHTPPLVAEKSWSYLSELEVSKLQLENLARKFPETGRAANDFREKIEAALNKLPPPAQPADIHRDLYPANILVEKENPRYSVWLLDLDLVAQGDAAIDVGNLMAEVKLEALMQKENLDAFDAWNKAFLDAYRFEGSRPPGRLSLFVAITLARNAGINAATEQWRGTSLPLFEGARQWLARAQKEGL